MERNPGYAGLWERRPRRDHTGASASTLPSVSFTIPPSALPLPTTVIPSIQDPSRER